MSNPNIILYIAAAVTLLTSIGISLLALTLHHIVGGSPGWYLIGAGALSLAATVAFLKFITTK